jgi:hypothetical protein
MVLTEVAAEELRGDVGVGHAGGMKQQARVVRLSQRVGVGAQALPEPRREQRALQAMLERQPHTEIGRQAEHADDLRGADSFGTHHSSCRHAADATSASCPLPGQQTARRSAHVAPASPAGAALLLVQDKRLLNVREREGDGSFAARRVVGRAEYRWRRWRRCVRVVAGVSEVEPQTTARDDTRTSGPSARQTPVRDDDHACRSSLRHLDSVRPSRVPQLTWPLRRCGQ